MADVVSALSVPGLTAGLLVLLMGAALLAGWVDAVVGGGGLVQLPALLLVPGLPPTHALGTNKVSSVMGTTAAAATYRRQVGFPTHVLSTAGLAFAAASGGALTATRLPTEVFRPVIVAALLVVLAVTVLKPGSFTGSDGYPGSGRGHRARRPRAGAPGPTVLPDGAMPQRRATIPRDAAGPGSTRGPERPTPHVRAARATRREGWTILRCLGLGAVIGFYDGMLGPGTGSFLLTGFILLVGLDTLRAAAMSKAVNLATNAGALLLFALAGVVEWRLGLLLGLANMCGGWLGARTATRLGPRFVRGALVAVVLVLLARMLSQQLG